MGSFATAEELTLLVANNTTGFFGVYHHPGATKPYHARVKHGGKKVDLGYFAIAEEAALCVARSLERQAARRWKVGAAKRAEARAQRVQNDEVDSWSM